MAIKGAFTFAEMVARLTRGYIKATGQQPDNLAKIKINLEAAEKVKQQNVVTEFPKDRITDPFKPRPTEEELLEAEYRRLKSLSPDEVKAEMRKKGFKPFEARPIKKFLTDDEATAQIEKLKGDLPFMERMDVLQLLDDIDAGKAYGAFDDVQRKELRDAISRIYTNKPDFASGGIAGELHLNRPGYANGLQVSEEDEDSQLGFVSSIGKILNNPLTRRYGLALITGGASIPTVAKEVLKQEAGKRVVSKGIQTLANMGGRDDPGRPESPSYGTRAGAYATYDRPGAKGSPGYHWAQGGRVKFDKGGMSRRKFLQLMGGLSAIPLVGKYFKAAKTAAPAVEAGIETIKRTAGGIPDYAYNLIEVVKNKGVMELIEGIYKRNPTAKKYTYKGVEVIEDGLGNTSVQKQQTKTGSWNDPVNDDVLVDDYVDREIGFEIKKGDDIVDEGLETQKGIRGSDEYTESTAYMQGEPDGGMDVSEIIEKIDDADHLELKKIADEIYIKKASGGVARLLGE